MGPCINCFYYKQPSFTVSFSWIKRLNYCLYLGVRRLLLGRHRNDTTSQERHLSEVTILIPGRMLITIIHLEWRDLGSSFLISMGFKVASNSSAKGQIIQQQPRKTTKEHLNMKRKILNSQDPFTFFPANMKFQVASLFSCFVVFLDVIWRPVNVSINNTGWKKHVLYKTYRDGCCCYWNQSCCKDRSLWARWQVR